MKTEDIRKSLNFRELGGYVSMDGRKVAEGQFYRSGPLCDLNEEELAFVKTLGIRHIFDFRSDYEAAQAPDPEIGAEYHLINALVDRSGGQVQFDPKGIEEAAALQRDEADDFLKMMYGNLPFSDAYKIMFDVIKAHETPILFHCSAGKDRTGIAALLILVLLGVDEETALEDYMLTNEYRREIIDRFFEKLGPVISDEETKQKLQAFEGVVRSSAEYSIQAVKKRFGDFDSYFEQVYGIDREKKEDLRETYLI